MTPIFIADDIATLEGAACYNPGAEGHPGPDLWFATDATDEQRGTTRAALKVCGGCSVRTACLEIALRNKEAHGIWGATTPAQRDHLLKGGAA